MIQDKAQFADNGCSLNKGCNAGLDYLWASLWARREAVACRVASLEKDGPFSARRALQSTASRHADMCLMYLSPHGYRSQYCPDYS